MKRTASEILRDLVESRALGEGLLADEARDFINSENADNLRRQRAERDARLRRLDRQQRERKRLGQFEIAPRVDIDKGVNYSADGIVLLRRGDVRLVWRHGGKYWSARNSHYSPAELQILDPERRTSIPVQGIGGRKLNDYGASRLNAALLFRGSEHIDKVFGPGAWKRAADAVASKRTIELCSNRGESSPRHT